MNSTFYEFINIESLVTRWLWTQVFAGVTGIVTFYESGWVRLTGQVLFALHLQAPPHVRQGQER